MTVSEKWKGLAHLKQEHEIQNYSELLKIRKRQNSAISTLTYCELEDRTYTDPGVNATTPNPYVASTSLLPDGHRGVCYYRSSLPRVCSRIDVNMRVHILAHLLSSSWHA